MKKLLIVLGLVLPMTLIGCTRVEPNQAGVLMENYGKRDKADFKIVQGEHLLKKFASTPTTVRCFCGECASPIISIKTETPETHRLRIGTLDTSLEHKPTMHIFTAYKAEWDTICDGLPQYGERP